MKIIVVGAGIVGASCAYHLAQAGAEVTVIEAGSIGGGASAKSFGWINASFAETPAYYALRRAAIDRFAALSATLALPRVRWKGALWWEDEGAAFEDHWAEIQTHGYEATRIDAAGFATLEPHVANPPDLCVLGQVEGAADGAAIAQALLAASGAKIILGAEVSKVSARAAQTSHGAMQADHVVVAVGAASGDLLGLPMDNQAGLILHSQPIAPIVDHIIMSPDVHFRQDPAGHIVMGEIFSGGGLGARDVGRFAQEMLGRLRRRLPTADLDIAKINLGLRPVPKDGLPMVGWVDGVYAATMHSGITLGPLIGQLVAAEIMGETQAILAPFRPDREMS
ncbi:MAG: FAD-dependent oxidoreductase [Yoonia sp.]|nr:FAD-dependent oxidoreductase [Yoonia sp.]